MSARRWTFTENNSELSHEQIEQLFTEGKSYKYLIFQLEVGENNTPHYQGFVIFDGVRRLSALKKLLPRAHWEPARGSSLQNRHYCSKPIVDCNCTHCKDCQAPLSGPWQYGECPEGAGDRSDLKQLRESFKAGKRKRELIEDDAMLPTYAKHRKFAHELISLYPPARVAAPEVTLLYGPAGCGKTRQVFDTEDPEELWTTPVDDATWFDGYDGHGAALLDDFAGRLNKYSLNKLLRTLDRYPAKFPVKGSYVWFAPKRIYITTNIHPREWYEWEKREVQYAALQRRFTRVIAWRATGTESKQLDNGSEEFRKFFSTYQNRGVIGLEGGRIGVRIEPVDTFDFIY